LALDHERPATRSNRRTNLSQRRVRRSFKPHPGEGDRTMSAGFAPIAAMLKARSGLTLGPDKLYLMETLVSIMRRENTRDLAALAAKLRPGSALEREIVEAMTTNESLFFRDTKPFDALKLRVLPRLHAARPQGARLRIWSAAASTGQEAYSIAMLLAEMTGLLGDRKIEILGTDIARDALQRAREGAYTQFEIQRGLPMQMLVKYFTKEDQQWRLKPAIRNGVEFREFNLLAELRSLGQFDIIFCRNVLIYFDAPTKTRVLEAISSQMAADGVLFLGGAETVLGLTTALQAVPGESGAYARAATSAPIRAAPAV
jgi:chemotaxis protein methyltransferase CheR